MEINDFEIVLHSNCFKDWLLNNIDNLIIGGSGFSRENSITKAIVDCMVNTSIVTQKKSLDIWDQATNDISEAAHNQISQPATWGPEHIISDFYKRLSQGYSNDFFGLMYLMDVENLDPRSKYPYSKDHNRIPRPFLLQTKVLIEKYLNRFPGKIRIHESFHGLKSPTESTILNYDIYVVKMKLNFKNAIFLFNEFHSEDFFKSTCFPVELLDD